MTRQYPYIRKIKCSPICELEATGQEYYFVAMVKMPGMANRVRCGHSLCAGAHLTEEEAWQCKLKLEAAGSNAWQYHGRAQRDARPKDRAAMKDGAGREIDPNQFETWVVSQAIRNRLEMFHGGGAIDPENPDSDEGFITDKQMRALNIVIRYTVHEALSMLSGSPPISENNADRYCWWQLQTVDGYMEPPGTPELRRAYVEVSEDDQPEIQDWSWPGDDD